MKKKELAPTDQYTRGQIRTLIANLLGDRNRIFEMGESRIKPEMLPADMVNEKHFLELIYKYSQCPSIETLTNHLKLGENDHLVPALQELYNCRTSDGLVAPIAFTLHHWLDHKKMEQAIEEAKVRLSQYDANNSLTHRELIQIISTARPNGGDNASRMTQVERLDFKIQQQIKRLDSGKSKRPVWPFPSLNLLLPPLRPADLHLIVATRKQGKSTLSSVLVENFAWAQQFDVLVLQFETDHTSFQDRQDARHLHIQVRDQKDIDPRDTRPIAYLEDGRKVSFKALYDSYRKQMALYEEQYGTVTYLHCPRWSIEEVKAEVEFQRAESMKRDHCLIVLLDHINAMPKPKGYQERERLDELINGIKEIPESYAETEWPVYMIAFDQAPADDDDIPNDPEKIMKTLKNVRSRGTSMGAIRAQCVLYLVRPVAEFDEFVKYACRDENGEVMLDEHGYIKSWLPVDALGFKRYYHRVGDLDHGWIFVAQVNDGMPGWVNLQVEDALFRMQEASMEDQTCPKVKEEYERSLKTAEILG